MREDNAVAQHAPQTVASTSLNTDPRPLFSTLTEHKRLRYQQYAMSSVRQQEQPTLHRPTSAKSKSRSLQEGSAKMQPTDDTSAAGQSHQHSSVSNDTDKEETQLCSPGEGVPRRRVSPPSNHLSNTTAVHRSPDSPLGNRQESRRRMVTPVSRSLSPLPPTQSSANRRSIKKPGSIIQDRMEVIPDSEPLRGSSPEEVCSEKTDSRQVDSKLHTGTHRNEKVDDAMDIVQIQLQRRKRTKDG
ncbi:hypothetical protein BDQ17DRAFT_427818 [Cyathus striatus]|nr:hypothetical protein BDQ17DRAFT_427818 [Cyathus striatus]